MNISKLPSTLLFTGPAGSATLRLSLAYATYIHCIQPSLTDACGTCSSCTKMLRLTHPDLHFALPIGRTSQTKGKDVTVANFMTPWRTFIKNHPYGNLQDWSKVLEHEPKKLQIGKPQIEHLKHISSLKPFESNYSIILIWLAEHLHPAAANALLKTLEEPPKHTTFILLTNDTSQLLPTVHSRALKIYIPAFSDEDILTTLQNQYPNLSRLQHNLVVQVAQGNMNKASKLALDEQEDYLEHFTNWLRAIYSQHWTNLINLTETLSKRPIQTQKNWLIYGTHMIRGTLFTSFGQESLAQLTSQELDLCQKLAKAFATQHLHTIIPHFQATIYNLDRHAQSKLALLDLAISFAHLIHPPKKKI